MTEHPWMPRGQALDLSHYPTLREALGKSQSVLQVLATDPTADLGDLALLGRGGHRSMLLAPAVTQSEVVGVLMALVSAERPWTRAETSRARILAVQLAGALEAREAQLVALPGAAIAPDAGHAKLP